VFSSFIIPDDGQTPVTQVILSFIHHRQKPLDSNTASSRKHGMSIQSTILEMSLDMRGFASKTLEIQRVTRPWERQSEWIKCRDAVDLPVETQ
jgi:hypothetical protein